MNAKPFDDGHQPENLGNVLTRICESPLFQQKKSAQVHVYRNALPESLVEAAYERTSGRGQPAWGDYVTISHIEKYWEDHPNRKVSSPELSDNLGVALAAHFIIYSLGEAGKPSRHFDSEGDSTPHPLWKRKDMYDHAHGVAVWGLAAPIGSEVPYHLDYAEQLRYESNIIVPPIVAGTLQCTRDKVHGGAFVVSLEGISHYQKHGYKGKLCQPCVDDMVIVPYEFNQLTCHLGNLPHGSTKIESIVGDQMRVIVGFNVFGHDVGETVQRAPEHSDQFRRKVRLQRMVLRNNADGGALSLEKVKNNRPLAKLLVLAKRQRIKDEFQKAQGWLVKEIEALLPSTVQDLMDCLLCKNPGYCWPSSPTDIQVFIHQRILHGQWQRQGDYDNAEGLIHPKTVVDIARQGEPCDTAELGTKCSRVKK